MGSVQGVPRGVCMQCMYACIHKCMYTVKTFLSVHDQRKLWLSVKLCACACACARACNSTTAVYLWQTFLNSF